MTGWKLKRFWSDVTLAEDAEGFFVLLDSRRLRTPGKVPLVLPSRPLAEWIAAEWREQKDEVQPRTMPATRTANSAVDKVMPQRAEVATLLVAYGETDLLCYRAEAPVPLAERQAAGWNPWLGWAERQFAARLVTVEGVMPIRQDPAALSRLRAEVEALTPFRLAAFHDLVALSGSLILALAVAKGEIAPDRAWDLSRIDEDWQAEQWGSDPEAEAVAARRRADFLHAARFLQLC
ncbi:MAG: ATPase [Rubellimicrobium sp.]|nr:ATPase [Rubellimicrobium sp.]